MSRYIWVGVASLALLGCGGASATSKGFVNRGLSDQASWLIKEVNRRPTPAKKPSSDAPLNYQAQFSVQVASRTNKGQLHDAEERSDLPDLLLYIRINGERIRIGESTNALQLTTKYPVRLKPGDSIEVRLVDRKNKYFRVQYGSNNDRDWSRERIQERPLSQFSFIFEGPGRYFFHQGYGLFFVDLRALR